MIVGRFLGLSALAAVGATYSLHFLTLGFVQGACVGFGIPLAQSFGAGASGDVRRYFWNGTWLCCLLSILLCAAMTAFARPLLLLIQTPEDVLDMAVTYIRILFLGIPASMLYNYSASVLRALGDSKHPLYFLIAASLLNIALDYICIVPLRMGVGGAAATVFSQLVSGLLNTGWLIAKTDAVRLNRTEMQLSAPHLWKLCCIGLPMGPEYSVSAIGAVVMQSAINSFGSVIIAAQTTGEKIRQMLTLPMESVGMAMATYIGQNYGANRIDRIRQGIRAGLCIQACWCVFSLGLVAVFGNWAVSLVMGANAGIAGQEAATYLRLISLLFILHGALMIFRNTLQGLGHSLLAVVSGVGELVGRSLGGALAVILASYTMICFTNPLAWGLSLCYCAWMTHKILGRKN